MLGFGLNQVTMPHAPIAEFVDAAARLGVIGVELRNDLARPIFDDLPVRQLREMLSNSGLRLLGVSQVYPFNRWSDRVADEVQNLIDVASEAGAETINLIPCNDGSRVDAATRRGDLTRALEASLPFLEAGEMVALIEPLGFSRSSLRHKAELVAVTDALGAQNRLRIVHDTFHHALAGGGPVFAERTGIVHISGVSDPDVPLERMEDKHRVLVDDDDRLGNLEQIAELQAMGYQGVYSFECFSAEIQRHPALEDALRKSIKFISEHVKDMAHSERDKFPRAAPSGEFTGVPDAQSGRKYNEEDMFSR